MTTGAECILAAVHPSTTAGIVTAIATVITAIGGLVLSVSVLIPNLRTTRQVHTIVNQQRTDAQRYNVALAEVLRAHGIEIPVDQSLPVTGQPDFDDHSARGET